MSTTLQPHQLRVVDEREKLNTMLDALMEFFEKETFKTLSPEDKQLLSLQSSYMSGYLEILDRRITAFGGKKKYTCHKQVMAQPMTRQAYCDLRNWPVPKDENPTDEGYFVEYSEGPPNVPGYPTYVSWSPKGVFEAGYSETKL